MNSSNAGPGRFSSQGVVSRNSERVRTLLTVHAAARAATPEPTVERAVNGGRVSALPGPNGIIRIVGLADNGDWIAEFACRDRDFDERFVQRMERHVESVAGRRIAIVT